MRVPFGGLRSLWLPVLAGALLLPLIAAAARAAFHLPEPLDGLSQEGFKAMYRHDFAEGAKKFRETTVKMPAHPSGYIFLASLYWWQYSADFANPSEELQKKFFESAHKGIERADAWKSGGSQNIEADFWLGGAYGLIGRWHVSQFEWIRAYLNGKRGYNYL